MNHSTNAVVIVVEGMGLGLVGAYGSATAATPALDRLAGGGLVLDQCFVDSLVLEHQLESLWTGLHAAQRSADNASELHSMWSLLAQRKIPGRLITDCPEVASVAQRMGCEQIALVEVTARTELAEEADQCAAVEVFAAVIEELSIADTQGVVWVHSRGLKLPWDAPRTLRMQMTDPDDPEPPMELCVPSFPVDNATDPDLIVGWSQVAAAQVAAIDQAIESVVQAVQMRGDANSWSWLITSLGGYPLGEHGQIGWRVRQLFGEEVSIPAIIQASSGRLGARRGELCQMPDLLAILLECLGLKFDMPIWGRSLLNAPAPSAPQAWPVEHTLAWLEHAGCIWLRTPAWSIMCQPSTPSRLFVKPDDRWEVIDVASRRTDLVERLTELIDRTQRAAQTGKRVSLPRLEAVLCELCR